MNPEERSLLERTLKLAEENNEMLKSIRRSSRISLFMRVIYWLLIIGFSFGAYYFIQPYINMLMGLSGQVQGSVDNVEGIRDTLNDLLK